MNYLRTRFWLLRELISSSPAPKYYAAVSLGYVALVMMQINGSSMAEIDDDSSSTLIGHFRFIRGDEFFRWTPLLLGHRMNKSFHGVSELNNGTNFTSLINSHDVINLDATFLRILPVGNYFAAMWWLPVLLALIGIPLFLSQLGVKQSLAIPTSWLVVFSPNSAWWSNAILNIVGHTTLVFGLYLYLIRSGKLSKPALVIGNLILAFYGAGLIFLYQPVVIALLVLFLGPMTILSVKAGRRIFRVFPSLVLLMLLVGWNFLQDYDVYRIYLKTIYPGSRHTPGGLQGAIEWFFSGTMDWALLNPQQILSSNQSELSAGITLLLVPAILTISRHGLKGNNVKRSLIFSFTILFLWLVTPFPGLISPIFDRLSPVRMAGLLTAIAPLVAVIFLTKIWEVTAQSGKFISRNWKNINFDFTSFTISFVLQLSGATYLRASIVNVELRYVFLFALVSSLFIGFITSAHLHWRLIGLWGLVLIAATISLPVNPVKIGVDNYYNNSFGKYVASTTQTSIWVTDDIFMDAILLANARSSLSSQQTFGPNLKAWRVLDSNFTQKDSWNRGQSYVSFKWNSILAEPKISNPAGDVIQVEMAPCDSRLSTLGVNFIATYDPNLRGDCLLKVSPKSLNLRGKPIFIFTLLKS